MGLLFPALHGCSTKQLLQYKRICVTSFTFPSHLSWPEHLAHTCGLFNFLTEVTRWKECHDPQLSHLWITLSSAYLIRGLCWFAYTPVQRLILNICLCAECYGRCRCKHGRIEKSTSQAWLYQGTLQAGVYKTRHIQSSKLSASRGEVMWRAGHDMGWATGGVPCPP